MGEIKLFDDHKLYFFHIPVKLEYFGDFKKNKYRNFTAFLVKKWQFLLVFCIYLLE